MRYSAETPESTTESSTQESSQKSQSHEITTEPLPDGDAKATDKKGEFVSLHKHYGYKCCMKLGLDHSALILLQNFSRNTPLGIHLRDILA